MAVSNTLLLFQATCYVVAFILSLCSLVPLAVNLRCFRGHCLLFTTGTFSDDGNFVASWASTGYCVYTLLVSGLLVVISFVQFIRMFAMLRKGTDSSFLSAFLDCLVTLFLSVAVFVASVLVTMGFKTWCDAVNQRFSSCDDASVMEISQAEGVSAKGFYLEIGTLQFGVWSSWVSCVLLTVLSFLKLCRYHEQEGIRVSMARQRQKIIHQVDQDSFEDE